MFFLKPDYIISDLSLSHPTDNSDMTPDDPQMTSNDQHFVEVNSTVHPDRTHLCPNCSKGFKSKQQLAQHSLVHTGIRKHICSFCDKGFKQLCHLQQHLRIHTGNWKLLEFFLVLNWNIKRISFIDLGKMTMPNCSYVCIFVYLGYLHVTFMKMVWFYCSLWN